MPSADPGAPAVRPADVERWFAEIGLEPLERADRDGITSWDLLLDGRRRHDLRVTVILDPTLAVIVLGALRAAHRRHVPQVLPQAPALERRVPVREVLGGRGRAAAARERAADRGRRRPTPGPAPSPASSMSPTACSTRRRAGSGSAGMPDRTGRPGRPQRGFLDRYADRLPSAAPTDGAPLAMTARRGRVGGRSLAGARRRRGRPARRPRPASPRSEPRRRTSRSSRTPATTSSRPSHRVRVTVDAAAHEPPQGHHHQALLLRRGLPGGPARSVRLHLTRRRQPGRVGQPHDGATPRSCGSSSGRGCSAGKSATLHAALRPRRPAAARRPGTCASATRSCRSRSGPTPPTPRRAAP